LKKAEQEITKWKYKFNLKNAEHILLYHELEKAKKNSYWPWLAALVLLAMAVILLTKES
jgi:hypothetical protein